ncbi:MAG: 50S ribosomal protein L29 [Bacteroidia bacterium]|nr:50S ribosomal protein L29 [Bacteroidia bacterium]
MKTKDIRELTDAEVAARIREEKDHLLKLRLNNAISAIESPAKIRESRKTIARLNTVLRERKGNSTTNKN